MKRAIPVIVMIALGGALGALGFLRDRIVWERDFLFGDLFVLTLSLGGLLVGMVLGAVGAVWAPPLRRIHEALAGALPLPLLALLYFPDARQPTVIGGIIVILVIEEALRAASLHDSRRARAIATVGLPIVAVAFSLVTFDGIVPTIAPGWSSDVAGLYLMVAAFAGGLGATALVVGLRHRALELTRSHASAIGRTELAAVCLWAYIGFCAFLIVWIADLPHEVTFFVARMRGAMKVMTAILVVGHFVFPFLILLFRAPKRHFAFVAAMGAWLVAMHLIDCAWLVAPPLSPFVAGPFLLLSGLALAITQLRFARHTILPPPSPEREKALAYKEAW